MMKACVSSAFLPLQRVGKIHQIDNMLGIYHHWGALVLRNYTTYEKTDILAQIIKESEPPSSNKGLSRCLNCKVFKKLWLIQHAIDSNL